MLEESVVKVFHGNLIGTINSILRTPFFLMKPFNSLLKVLKGVTYFSDSWMPVLLPPLITAF